MVLHNYDRLIDRLITPLCLCWQNLKMLFFERLFLKIFWHPSVGSETGSDITVSFGVNLWLADRGVSCLDCCWVSIFLHVRGQQSGRLIYIRFKVSRPSSGGIQVVETCWILSHFSSLIIPNGTLRKIIYWNRETCVFPLWTWAVWLFIYSGAAADPGWNMN